MIRFLFWKASTLLCLCACVIPFLSVTEISAKGPDDPLWLKALRVTGESMGLVPTEIREEIRVYRKKTKIDQHTLSLYEVSKDDKGVIQGRLVKSTRNGKEFTKGRQKELDRQKDKKILKEEQNIFLPENQDSITVRRTGQIRDINGRKCVAMEYVQMLSSSVEKGIVWLDVVTGTPYRLETVPQKVPELYEKVVLRKTEVAFDYAVSPDGRWTLNKMIINAEIEFTAFLFFTYKGHCLIETVFDKYKRL